jgi:hypothetical protein
METWAANTIVLNALKKLAKLHGYSDESKMSRAFDLFGIEEMQRLEKAANRPALNKGDSNWFIRENSLIPKGEPLQSSLALSKMKAQMQRQYASS